MKDQLFVGKGLVGGLRDQRLLAIGFGNLLVVELKGFALAVCCHSSQLGMFAEDVQALAVLGAMRESHHHP